MAETEGTAIAITGYRKSDRYLGDAASKWRLVQKLLLFEIVRVLMRCDDFARFIKHADDRPVRARARAVLRVRDRVADCVGSCIPDWAQSQPIADQIKAVPVLAGTDLVNVLGGGGGHFHPAVCVSPKLVC